MNFYNCLHPILAPDCSDHNEGNELSEGKNQCHHIVFKKGKRNQFRKFLMGQYGAKFIKILVLMNETNTFIPAADDS